MSKVAVIQMVSNASWEVNKLNAMKLVGQAREQGAELVLLPENFAFMGLEEKDKLAIAEPYQQGVLQAALSDIARDNSVWVIAGTLPIISQDANKVKSASIVYDNTGKVAARYDKIHLFDVRVSETEEHKESDSVTPGDELVVVDTPIGKVGLSVCYDLRFPELYQQLREKGAEIFSIPAAFTAVTGLAHWEVLLRARAIENLCYVLAANQGGSHENGRHTYGHSMIVGPWGKVLACASLGEALVVDEIDLSRITFLRQQFPCNEHHVL